MDEEKIAQQRVERLLEEHIELSRETNRMVRDLRRWTRIGFWTRIGIWLVAIVLPLILIGSLIKSFVPAVGGSSSTAPAGLNAFGLPSQEQLQQTIELYLNGGEESQ